MSKKTTSVEFQHERTHEKVRITITSSWSTSQEAAEKLILKTFEDAKDQFTDQDAWYLSDIEWEGKATDE